MRPLKKGETLTDYGKAATRALTKRTSLALEASNRHAAWKVIFKAICAQGEWMRFCAPAAFVVYELYVANALTFLHTFPSPRKAKQLTDRAIADLSASRDFLALMNDDNFSPAESAAICAAITEVTVSIQALSAHFQK
jgi:hypothetical protein